MIAVILFGILYLFMILYTRRKGDFAEYAVAGRSLGGFLIFSSICASFIGPGMTLGFSREGFTSGFFLCLVASIGGVGLLITALVFAPKVRAKFTDSYSIGDIIGGPLGHDHRGVRIVVGLVLVCFLTASTVATAYAGGELVNNVFGFSKTVSIATITVLVVIYSSFGGIRATIQTDAIQFGHFAILIPILALLLVLDRDFYWPDYAAQAIDSTAAALGAESAAGIAGMMLFWFLTLMGPHATIINRFLASRDVQVAKRSMAYAALFLVLWLFLLVFIGSAGAHLHPHFAANDQVLLEIGKVYFPGILYGIFIIALVGVIVSTQDTALNTASIIFSEDILTGIKPTLPDAQKLFYSKLATVGIGLIAVIIGGYLTSILEVIVVIYSYYIPLIIPVTIFSLLKEKKYWQSAIAAILSGLLSTLLWSRFGNDLVPTLFTGVVGSTLAYWGTDLWMRKKERP